MPQLPPGIHEVLGPAQTGPSGSQSGSAKSSIA